ncbi:MAG: LamG-like jellyroll fold domain-containing protein [Candidatus Paceibacterota bacterium]
MDKKLKIAFTLIELLVVIAIIGILSGLIVVTMDGVTQKANVARGQVFSNSLRSALMLNLVSEWKMNEGTGQYAVDGWSSINGRLGSTSGADDNDPAWASSGCVNGSCLDFDGSNDYVKIDNDQRLNIREGSITVSSWVKFKNFASISYSEIFYGGATGGGYGYGYMINTSGSICYEIRGSSGVRNFFSINAGLGLNKWYHLVMTFDASNNNLRMYRDGTVVDNRTFSDPGDIISASSSFVIGAYGDLTQYFLSAYVDEFRVFAAAVPVSQIKEQYYSGLNSLLSGNSISKEDYFSRISQLAINN